MKHITRKQSRIIAKHIKNLFEKHYAWWDTEPMTIKEIAEDVYARTETVYWYLCDMQIKTIEAFDEFTPILNMFRHPDIYFLQT